MKLFIKKEDLQKALSVCAQAIPKLSTNPLMEGVLFSASNEELKLTTYDFTNAIVCKVKSNIESPGEFVMSYKLLVGIVNKCIDEIAFEINGNLCEIVSGRSVYSIPIFKGEEYPELPTPNTTNNNITMPVALLKKALKAVGHAVSNNINNGNPLMSTIKIDIENNNIVFVGCDGYRIAKYSEPFESDDFSIILEKATVKNLANLDAENVTIEKGTRHHIITTGDITLIVKTFNGGEFLDYKKVFAQPVKLSGRISVNDFGGAINMAIPVVDNAAKTPIRIKFGDDIKISSYSSIGKVNTECPMIEPVEPLEIGFNSHFLIDALNACENEEVKIELSNSVSPMRIIDKNSVFLILPMRLKNI